MKYSWSQEERARTGSRACGKSRQAIPQGLKPIASRAVKSEPLETRGELKLRPPLRDTFFRKLSGLCYRDGQGDRSIRRAVGNLDGLAIFTAILEAILILWAEMSVVLYQLRRYSPLNCDS